MNSERQFSKDIGPFNRELTEEDRHPVIGPDVLGTQSVLAHQREALETGEQDD